MSEDRKIRNTAMKKQARPISKTGNPGSSELSEGAPQFRMINGVLKMCIKVNNEIWYFTGSRNV